jgi:hypothetical protein
MPRRHHRGDRHGVLASARGVGYRRIAADIGRPLSTVRRWLRSVRGSHTQRLHTQGVDPPRRRGVNPAAPAENHTPTGPRTPTTAATRADPGRLDCRPQRYPANHGATIKTTTAPDA